jgi:hypothetical protein
MEVAVRKVVRLLIVILAAVIPGVAAAAAPTLAVRVGGVLEGPQHTLTNGFVMGGSVEWPRSFGALGIALEWAGESGNNDLYGYQSVFHAGAFARWEIGGGGVRPFLEGGVGVSHRTPDGGTGPLQFAESGAGPGAWVGAGAAMPVSITRIVRLDARYSVLTIDAPNAVDAGGDHGDYFSVALSFAFAR